MKTILLNRKNTAHVLLGFVLVSLVAIVACTSEVLVNKQLEDNVDCTSVYSSFTDVLRSLDGVDFVTEDVHQYVDIAIESFKAKDVVNPSIFESCVLITKSQEDEDLFNPNTEDCINALSLKFGSRLVGQIWNEMEYALIQGMWNENLFLNKIEKSPISSIAKEYLTIVLATYNNIYEYPVLFMTKGSFDDCYNSYLRGLSNARKIAALGVLAGPVGLIGATIAYRIALDELERGFEDCVR